MAGALPAVAFDFSFSYYATFKLKGLAARKPGPVSALCIGMKAKIGVSKHVGVFQVSAALLLCACSVASASAAPAAANGMAEASAATLAVQGSGSEPNNGTLLLTGIALLGSAAVARRIRRQTDAVDGSDESL
jgi:hypothetical protein